MLIAARFYPISDNVRDLQTTQLQTMTNLLKKAENIIKEIKEKHCCELAVIKNELTSSRGKPFFFSTVKVRQISDVYNLSVLLFIRNWVNLNTFIETWKGTTLLFFL